MKKFWTAEEDALMRLHYPNNNMKFMANLLQRSECSIYNRAFTLDINKSEEYLASPDAYRFRREQTEAQNRYHFPKEHTPFNKGMKGWSAKGTEATRFKKGTVPPNHKPVGTIRTIRDSKDGYQEIKMAEGMRQWKLLHRVVWERMNGAIPAKHIVIFLDGNVKNINIKNLAVISRKENALRNSHYNNYPKEISQLIQLRGAVNRQINKRIKNEQHANA